MNKRQRKKKKDDKRFNRFIKKMKKNLNFVQMSIDLEGFGKTISPMYAGVLLSEALTFEISAMKSLGVKIE